MADTIPTLSISAEKVRFIVVKAREFDVKDVLTDEDDGSNAADDGMVEVLEDHPDDPVVQELTSFIDRSRHTGLARTWRRRPRRLE